MIKRIDEVEFTIFDTETTGLSPDLGDRVVEIAAIRIKGDKVMGTFESLINPGRDISEAAFNVNHISARMLISAPRSQEIMPRFLDFIEGSCLCAYNAGFDLGFLNNELQLMGKGQLEGTIVVDALRIAKGLLPGLERYALWFVAEKLGIKQEQAHRALSDVKLTLGVFNKLREIAQIKGIVDFKDFFGLFGVNQRSLKDINSQKISEIQEAIDLGVKLKIKYFSRSGAEVTEREVAPKEIRQEKDAFYLVGHCSLRNEERTFRVDNILNLEIL
jgi:DNA polymerase III epsilon subunit family exonuclease